MKASVASGPGISCFSRQLEKINEAFVRTDAQWAGLRRSVKSRATGPVHGDVGRWQQAIRALGSFSDRQMGSDFARHLLMQLHPWRKGPLRLYGYTIDAEWRSDWKWNRFLSGSKASNRPVDLTGRKILDVGCGNGYYMYRMLEAGAHSVVGIEPMLLFGCQFQALYQYSPDTRLAFISSCLEDCLSSGESFDLIFSMGVLYHRRDQMGHLENLFARLVRGGQLVLETLVLEDRVQEELKPCLEPEGRYAQMSNVWSIPGLPLLEKRLKMAGFDDPDLLDLTYTTVAEQRTTDWMRFQSLEAFLDPGDRRKTCEGYQAPLRVVLSAVKP